MTRVFLRNEGYLGRQDKISKYLQGPTPEKLFPV